MSRNGRRRRHRIHRPHEAGLSPGTVRVDPEAHPTRIRAIAYGPGECVDRALASPEEIPGLLARHAVTWIDVEGLGDERTLRRLGEIFEMHRLALEDVVNLNQRAKVERYPGHFFIVAHMVSLPDRLENEQISMLEGRNFVLTFQTVPGDCLEPVRRRIRESIGRIRTADASYLAYAILDAVIDGHFPVLEELGERLERLEDDIVLNAREDVIPRIHAIKRDLLHLRRLVWPLNEAVGALSRHAGPEIAEETRLHLRDCHDHVLRIIELIENYRETGSDLMDMNLTLLGNRTNEVMKVLTIISTIFIPLSFVAGVYGMNFDPAAGPWNMPELDWKWGYPAALSLMAGMAAAMLAFFARKGWLGAMRGRRAIPSSVLSSEADEGARVARGPRGRDDRRGG